MAVDPNIKKKADDIRNKIYGREVRESLASGLEEMSSDVSENEGRQSVVEGRQDSVESRWQAVSDEMTDKDVISAPEIIAARNGESNLKARLDKENQEVTEQFAQTEEQLKLSDLYDKVYGSLSIYNKPSGFPIEIPFDILLSASGKVAHNYDVAVNKNLVTTRYYVDVELGDNNNPGTEEQPFKGLSRAFRHEPVDEIVIKSGVYGWRGGEGNTSYMWGNHSFNIIGDGDVFIGAHRDEQVWSNVEGAYVTNASNVTEIVDIENYENPVFYKRMDSIEAVKNEKGSYFIAGNDVYVKTLYDGEPNNKILLNLGYNSALNLREHGKIYCENIKFTNTFTMENDEHAGELYVKNCDFFIGTSKNALSVNGDVYFELQNCRAMYGERDGFNYHMINGKLPRGIEIDCYGAYNGRDGNNQNNGSTMHDGGEIIRIGGEYSNNHGPNVIDVNDGTKSLNIGVHAHHSTATSSLSNVDFRTRDDADMWLVNCVSHDSEYSTSTGSPARMYKENTLLLSEEVVI